MALDWATKKTTFTNKLKVSSFGRVGNITSGVDAITTNHTKITYVDCGAKEVGIAENVLGPTCSVSMSDGGTKIWGLPWEKSFAGRTQLGAGGSSIFLTPSLNGCCVMISGTTVQPVVVHANCQPTALLTPVSDNQPLYFRLWSDVYVTVASQLVAKGHIPDTNLELLQPTDYMLAGVSDASVFGVRSGGNWSFYVVVNRTAGGTTRKIWG
jgi:hypothetical protein